MTVTISNVTELEGQEKIVLTASEVSSRTRVQVSAGPEDVTEEGWLVIVRWSASWPTVVGNTHILYQHPTFFLHQWCIIKPT